MKKKDSKATKDDNVVVCSILSYLLIGIIWFFVDEKLRKEKLCRFHAQQGAIFLIFYLIWGIAFSVIIGFFNLFLFFITYTGNIVLGVFTPIITVFGLLAWTVPLILLIMGIINAANKKMKELPIIGKYGNKFKF